MARDYKPKRKRPGSKFSGWIGVVCGLAAGLAIAAAIYVKDHRPDAAGTKVTAKTDKKHPRGGELGEADNAESGPPDDSAKSYAFYSMLPKFEVVVPEKDKDVRPDARAVPETRSGTYVLQAGSYAPNWRCRGSSPRFRKSRSTTIPGTGSASVPSRIWTSSTTCAPSCARPMSTCW
jgi:hypothetical protein